MRKMSSYLSVYLSICILCRINTFNRELAEESVPLLQFESLTTRCHQWIASVTWYINILLFFLVFVGNKTCIHILKYNVNPQCCSPVLQFILICLKLVIAGKKKRLLSSCTLVSNFCVFSHHELAIAHWGKSDSALGDHQHWSHMLVPAFHQHPQDSGHCCLLQILCRERSHSQLLCPSVYSQFITLNSPGGPRDHQPQARMDGPPKSWIKLC